MIRKLCFVAALLTLALSVHAGSVCAEEAQGEPLVLLSANEEATLSFVPPANSEYAVCLFPMGEEDIRGVAEIWRGDESIAAGVGKGELCSAWLVAGQRYELRLRACAPALAEVARHALSRCFSRPLELEENVPGGKMIARAWDAHWYSFTAAADGRLMLSCVPESEDMTLRAALFDGDGAFISELEQLPGGACMMLLDTKAGGEYALRISAPDGGTGYYFIALHRRQGDTITEVLRFGGGDKVELATGGSVDLSAQLSGEALLWASDAPGVATVSQAGVVSGVSAGSARITAYGISTQASCTVEVADVALTGLRIPDASIALQVGESARTEVEILPHNASVRALNYSISDPDVASVSAQGIITAHSAGEVTLRVTDPSGRFSATVGVLVSEADARYRALLIGEQHYPFGGYEERNGSQATVEALAGLLNSGRFEQTGYSVQLCADLSRAELIAAIRGAFSEAAAGDVSLIYISCHGHYTGGMSFLELSDGSSLAARDLERELRRIPGDVVLMLDCCGSGGAIGRASGRADFAKNISGAFAGASIRGSKYRVLCSAALDEDSYRVAFRGGSGTGAMTTVFARALCDGAGWDTDRAARGTMGADADYDGEITLAELALYLPERVDWYLRQAEALTGSSLAQSVVCLPEGDPFVLFG